MRFSCKSLVISLPLLLAACMPGSTGLPSGGPAWGKPFIVAEGQDLSGATILESDKTIHLLWTQGGNTILEKRHSKDQEWSEGWSGQETVATGTLQAAAADGNGVVTLLYKDAATESLMARQFTPTIGWGQVLELGVFPASASDWTDTKGDLHFFFLASESLKSGGGNLGPVHLYHLRPADGAWQPAIVLAADASGSVDDYTITQDPDGGLTAVATTSGTQTTALKYQAGSGWVPIGTLTIRPKQVLNNGADGLYVLGNSELVRLHVLGSWSVIHTFYPQTIIKQRLATGPRNQLMLVWSDPGRAWWGVPRSGDKTLFRYYDPTTGWGGNRIIATGPDNRYLEFGPDGDALLIFNHQGNLASSHFHPEVGWTSPEVLVPVSQTSPTSPSTLTPRFIRNGNHAMMYENGASDEINAHLFYRDTGWTPKTLLGNGTMPWFACLSETGEAMLSYFNSNQRALVSAWHQPELLNGRPQYDTETGWRESVIAEISYESVKEVRSYVTADETLLALVRTENALEMHSVQLPNNCKPDLSTMNPENDYWDSHWNWAGF